MIRLLVITLIGLLTPLLLISQENRCLWNLEYGLSQDSVLHKLKKEENLETKEIRDMGDNNSVVTYFNCKIEGCNAKIVNLYFENKQLISSEATFEPDNLIVFKVFTHLLKALSKQFGPPQAMNKKYVKIKEAGKKREIFVGGKVALWVFPQDDSVNTINLMVTERNEIKLDYIHIKNEITWN